MSKSRPFASNASKYGEYSSKSLADKYEKSKELLVPEVKSDKVDDEIVGENAVQNDQEFEVVENEQVQFEEVIEDPNVLGAKLLKAELMGDDEVVKSLKSRLESAQKIADVARKELKAQEIQDLNEQLNPYKKSSHKKKSHHKSHHKNEDRQRNDRQKKGPESENEGHVKKRHKVDDNNLKAEQVKKQDENPKMIDNCQYCFDNAKKHLIVSMGKYSYLAMPITRSITEGHCLIIPMHHCSSSVTCDEEVWEEIQQFRKALVKMFEPKRIDCVFFEQYSAHKKYHHMAIECVPLEMSVSNLAPIYFKKAIIESESEWATNKSIIDLKTKDLRSTIPRNMPYFSVDFGLDNGFAHVIENDDNFPDSFAKEIIGGILDLDPLSWRQTKNDDFGHQSKKVLDFLKWWKPYDFNKD